jgi:ABC-type branched-subunit amino acid transport system substrate-binding protein
MGSGRARRRRIVAVLLAAAVVSGACGSDDGDGADESAATTAAPSGTSASTSAPATTAAAGGAQTIDQLEAQWAAARQKVVDRLKAGKYGIDRATNTLKGPEGFSVDLSRCAAGWSNTEGVSDTEIKLGQTLSQSGNTADFGNMTKAWRVYMDYINTKFGGIPDSTGKTRKLNLVSKDDGYDPARTIPFVDELLDSEKVFAMTNGGSANVLRTYDKVNSRCVPQLFVWTGHPAWGDPVNHPWTMGSILGYSTEAILWGTYMERTLPKGVKIAALVMNNDFGKSYLDGLRAYIAQSDHDFELISETFEPAAPTVKTEMTTLASHNPDVFIMMATGTPCTQAISEAAENGLQATAKQLWQPSVCKPLSIVGRDKVGDAADGWLIVGGGQVDLNDPTFVEKPAVKWARGLLSANGLDPKISSNLGAGFYLGWPFIETIRIAAQLDGGLNRTNLILASRSLDIESPFLLPGIKITTNGNKDAYPIEGSEFGRFDAAQQSWVQQGDIIELSGKSSNCMWDAAASVCKK